MRFARIEKGDYAPDKAGNRPQQSWGVYLSMFGHKTVLESIRATFQARQHLPDCFAYYATLIANPALPG